MTDPIVRSARFEELTTAELYALLRLRADVFVAEQQCAYADPDGRDIEPEARHVWSSDAGGAPMAYLRILSETDGAGRIGRVCTRADHRGGGLATLLLRRAIEDIGDRPIMLGAQAHLLAWYERLGFEVSGPDYVEDGIPHVPMRFVRPSA